MHIRVRSRIVAFIVLGTMLSACASNSLLTKSSSLLPSNVSRATQNALLYASDYTYGNVTIYTFPQGQEVTSFGVPGGPQGLCSDKNGNVFIAEPYGRKVEEYAHGETSPTATFDFKPSPYGCAIDNTAQYLAVAGEAGSVGVFDLASSGSAPQTYTYSGIESFYYCTYDDQGNLFVDGQSFSGPTYLFELRKGSGSLKIVKLSGKIPVSGTVHWDGTYVAIDVGGGSNYDKVLRVAVNKYRAKIKGRVVLKGPRGYAGQYWIQGSTIMGPEDRSANLALWNYPAGGKPVAIIYGANYPLGMTVSVGY